MEAAELLLESVGAITDPGQLSPEKRRLALLAATYLVKAEKIEQAAKLYEALGETARAAKLLTTGHTGSSKRVPSATRKSDPLPKWTPTARGGGVPSVDTRRLTRGSSLFKRLSEEQGAAPKSRSMREQPARSKRESRPQLGLSQLELPSEPPSELSQLELPSEPPSELRQLEPKPPSGRGKLAPTMRSNTAETLGTSETDPLLTSPTHEPPPPSTDIISDTTISSPATFEDIEAAFPIGAVIADRYRVEAPLGRGGMSVVLRATDLELSEEIALKIFVLPVLDAESLAVSVERFRHELRLGRQLRHPNIIQLYDMGLHHGHRYLTMELLSGHTLDELLGEPLALDLGLNLVIQACKGLQAVHDRGVIHRDIKADNLFVTDDAVLKLMDFGIAKSAFAKGVTILGTLAGTPEYMAPEQINDFSSVEHTADQYALGVVAYAIFCGKLPFEHAELVPLLMKHVQEAPVPPKQLRPDLPDELNEVVLRMLAKNPTARFESCMAVAKRLEALRQAIGAF